VSSDVRAYLYCPAITRQVSRSARAPGVCALLIFLPYPFGREGNECVRCLESLWHHVVNSILPVSCLKVLFCHRSFRRGAVFQRIVARTRYTGRDKTFQSLRLRLPSGGRPGVLWKHCGTLAPQHVEDATYRDLVVLNLSQDIWQ
jgi:hypothetical protein